ncbi:2,3-bisphosphoglycerate-independent phosphoglycerate mutase [Desulfovibrio legallii]|uniref:2,3-bisphosphoglycerate-independent phosphoglycerate mutase n=1 Tax=Desulfovibrio legallii TaxID=571438 RepID=A0A1G7M6J8_9BACT|nr:2,3-bisphosphoglycerate-independent phosphoglycerate mutase [Desulfovibrio legallii]SDF57256.1 phosphoglycerate mutase [Desulfovibrio legallii]
MTTSRARLTPTLLLILDGWGLAAPGPGNAPWLAKTPQLDALNAACPHSRLAASGRDVGLPAGYMGNSEVGHLNIGAGRIVYQDMTRIDLALEDGSFAANPAITALLDATARTGGRLHLAGLLSDGGVHSHIRHLEALCALAHARNIPVRIHCFMDGRDRDPHSGADYMRALLAAVKGQPAARVASMTGRYYAMDRDKHWERLTLAWQAMVHARPLTDQDPVAAVEAAYQAGVTDEFIQPVAFAGEDAPGMADGDALFFFNFRADRMRQMVQAFIQPDFTGFDRGRVPALTAVASMTAYEADFNIPAAFPKEAVRGGLGETAADHGLRQLRLAETEKYAHVTYFFNGGAEAPFPGEDRILVPSPREVATYDLKPAMSAAQVTDRFVEAWNSGVYDLVVCNLANGDMVGHTGVLDAAVQACETVDQCVGRMAAAVKSRQGRMLIIADHGNCETMLTPDGRPHTAHTTNPVPCILLQPEGLPRPLADGRLADVAPTLLGLWGLPPSPAMTGRDLTGELTRG